MLLFFACIALEIVVHANVGGVTADVMSVSVDDGVYILIISLRATDLLGGSFGFRRSGIFTLYLMLNFCDVDFCHHFV